MPVRWSDVDLFGHVNNAAFLRFLDDARFATFPRMGVDVAGVVTDAVLVVVKHEIDYLAAVPFTSDPVTVEVWVSRIGTSSVDFGYEVRASAGTPLLRACSRMVQVDRGSGRPRAFSDAERADFSRYRDDAPTLRPW
ncbi:acyl-CoA thioesterase [Litorihabitans aurantiacus]|nr:thioesterase family protein [Litorihabitans aurantiacus]